MKTIIKSVLFTVALALVMTGCQKETDDISVSLKSSVPGVAVDVWSPAGGAAAECTLAGSSCAYSYKVDPWAAGSYNTNGNTITISFNPDGSFNWTSQYPVCKVIVKAGRGALIYSYSPGVYRDNSLVGWHGKGISHATFCFGAPEEMSIAVKVMFTDGSIGVSPGNLYVAGWCEDFKFGYLPYNTPSTFKLYRAGDWEEDGRVEIYANGDVEVFANEGLTIDFTYVFVGALGALQTTNLDADGCPQYFVIPPWMYNNVDGASQLFDIP